MAFPGSAGCAGAGPRMVGMASSSVKEEPRSPPKDQHKKDKDKKHKKDKKDKKEKKSKKDKQESSDEVLNNSLLCGVAG